MLFASTNLSLVNMNITSNKVISPAKLLITSDKVISLVEQRNLQVIM
jgi:hypothetical protein